MSLALLSPEKIASLLLLSNSFGCHSFSASPSPLSLSSLSLLSLSPSLCLSSVQKVIELYIISSCLYYLFLYFIARFYYRNTVRELQTRFQSDNHPFVSVFTWHSAKTKVYLVIGDIVSDSPHFLCMGCIRCYMTYSFN